MNIQIFGKNKCFETKKAQRYFKERKISYQFVNLSQYGLSVGEYDKIEKAVGGYQNMLDEKSKNPELVLIRYLSDEDAVKEKLLECPDLFKTPIVRNGKWATVGYCPKIWETWE